MWIKYYSFVNLWSNCIYSRLGTNFEHHYCISLVIHLSHRLLHWYTTSTILNTILNHFKINAPKLPKNFCTDLLYVFFNKPGITTRLMTNYSINHLEISPSTFWLTWPVAFLAPNMRARIKPSLWVVARSETLDVRLAAIYASIDACNPPMQERKKHITNNRSLQYKNQRNQSHKESPDILPHINVKW